MVPRSPAENVTKRKELITSQMRVAQQRSSRARLSAPRGGRGGGPSAAHNVLTSGNQRQVLEEKATL
jgi:hypothetical protein